MRRRAKPREETKRSSANELVRLLLTVAVVGWLFRSLVFAPFSIPSGSMLPTLFIGDYLLVAKWPYGYSRYSFPWGIPSFSGRVPSGVPDRGDIVVFRAPGDEEEDVIKRVIGLPGDTIAVDSGKLVLNGKAVGRTATRPFVATVSANTPCRQVTDMGVLMGTAGQNRCAYQAFRETLPGGRSYTVLDQVAAGPGDNFPTVTVPAGHVFLMGDNRDDSLDSRFDPIEGGMGFVPLERIVGRATITFWSTDGSSSYVKPWTWFSALRTNRLGKTFG
ncbi:signal peptidase I [Sphingomonas sinipercae]|uniref:Signal peptidase I n=1 Tax=Sphingomonas sinipercae TaxID=2714944 RepID=A0A6G7ZMY3_9SPHN|nr:signal peptidase I [Sphingomonas sinipercae]QIL02344.1 signal peptidase I [Sphingomonas sinipercae]